MLVGHGIILSYDVTILASWVSLSCMVPTPCARRSPRPRLQGSSPRALLPFPDLLRRIPWPHQDLDPVGSRLGVYLRLSRTAPYRVRECGTLSHMPGAQCTTLLDFSHYILHRPFPVAPCDLAPNPRKPHGTVRLLALCPTPALSGRTLRPCSEPSQAPCQLAPRRTVCDGVGCESLRHD